MFLHLCRTDCRLLQHGGNDWFRSEPDALGADVCHIHRYFYELAVSRKLDIKENHIKPGGCVPFWVRWLVLIVTILALVAMFWISVGRYHASSLHTRGHVQIINDIENL